MSEHKPDPEFVKYLKDEVNNPFLSANVVRQMERVFIDQREKYEARLTPARMASEVWEKTMMEVIGEDGPASVADAIRKLQDQAARAQGGEAVPMAWVSEDSTEKQKVSGKSRRLWWENKPGVGFPIYRNSISAQRVPEPFMRLFKHARGLSFGQDWNKGTAQSYHRKPLVQAVEDCKAWLTTPTPAATAEQDSDSVRGVPRCQQCGNMEPFHATGCTQPYGEFTATTPETESHEWDDVGERCLKCGDKDWFAGPACQGRTPPQEQ